MDTAVLHVDGVDVVRGGRTLLDNIEFRVSAGEHWAVLGPNGAGKSTLMSLLGAVVHPTRGTVSVLGHRLGRVDMRQLRSEIGHVDPRQNIGPRLSALDATLTGLTNTSALPPRRQVTSTAQQRAASALATTGMEGRCDLLWPNPFQGERGRVLIARALMSRPRLLLLDEPCTGLDLAARERLLNALVHLQNDVPALSTVIVTRHLEAPAAQHQPCCAAPRRPDSCGRIGRRRAELRGCQYSL